MKKIIKILSLVLSLSLNSETGIPFTLENTLNNFIKQPESFSVYRVDLMIFENIKVLDSDKDESWPELERWEYSDNLVNLPEESSYLVNRESIEKGLRKTSRIINNVKFKNNKSEPKPSSNIQVTQYNNIPVKYLEEFKDKEFLEIVKKLSSNNDYKIIYKRSWFQPIFSKKQAFPVLISGNKDKELIYGELTIYKERFLHSNLTLRLAKKDSVQKYHLEIEKLYNFNELVEQIQEENKKTKERTYFWKDSFIPEMKISFSDFKEWFNLTSSFPTYKEEIEEIPEVEIDSIPVTYKDRFELSIERKMEDREMHYIDHPYFGVLIRLSLWSNLEAIERIKD
mgnify:CR=1 FL=1|tara:strand:+ start:2328 stop:3347 length:1020 start_codon:yes stop_codon:yes gene_type:complete